MRRLASAMLALAVTAGVFYFLVTPEIVADLEAAARHADPISLCAALGLILLVQYLRAWRFSALTWGRTAPPSAGLVRIALQLNFLNFALPFRLGELGYPALMRAGFGEPVLRSLGVLLMARLADLASVGAIVAAFAAMLDVWPHLTLWAAITAVLLLAAPLATIALRRKMAALIARSGHGRPRITAVADYIARMPVPAAMAALALTHILWLAFGLAAALIAGAVSGTVPVAVAMLGAAAGNLAFALPVNGVLGLGPSQAAFVAAVVPAGASWDDAIISALLLHAVVLVSALVFGGLASAWRPARD